MSKCIHNMWPPKLDMTKDECRGVLRRLELEAYSSVMSTFRAQGSLDNSKQNMLEQLRRCFHISEDRHKAEVRRVANCEKLNTISELMNGKSFELEWIREGHRSYPLIGRAAPCSALHILADHASKAAAIENSELPDPSDTKRSRMFDEEFAYKPICTEDPTLPPPSPIIFGISRKDLKKSLDISALNQSSRKKHYQHLKPPPPPNVKIQHLYQTLNAKRPRKSLTKKSSKTRATKQSPGRMHLPYPPDGAELQRHLTSQLMPPPMSPMKSPYAPILPAGKKDQNQMKLNNQPLEPQAHYIPNNPGRLKSELMGETAKMRSGRSKSINTQPRSSYQQRFANGAGPRSNMDHIPDPQIIFNTMSSTKTEQAMDVNTIAHNNHHHEIDMSHQSMASPLQLLSTAASCTPKLKIHNQQHPSTSHSLTLPSQNAMTKVQNRAIKIIPATHNTKPVIIKPSEAIKTTQSIIATQSPKYKIQKIQLMINKNQDGMTSTTNLPPSATIVSGKAGQLVLSGKGITNSYQVGGKSPYTIISGPKPAGAPKVIVQTIDRGFKENPDSLIPENQRITENTPIDFLPSTQGTTNYPKVIIQKTPTSTNKQIKLKLGSNLVNSKLIKSPIPTNLKIQRNINTKGFTVLNSSQIVQLQAQSQAIQAMPTTVVSEVTGSKVDWEQELDDANRTKGGKSSSRSNGAEIVAKKIRLDEDEAIVVESLHEVPETENVIVETVDMVDPSTNLVLFDNSSNVEVVPEQSQPIVSDASEYVFLNHEEHVLEKSVEEPQPSIVEVNGEENVENGVIDVEDERPPQNGAEAYESLVKSLTECESDYKDINDEAQMDENFGLIDEANILDTFGFTRESGLF